MAKGSSHSGIPRVLQLIASLPVGGAEDLVSAMVTGLDPRRFQVQAATIGPLGPVGEELRQAGHPVISLGLDLKRTSFWRILARVRALLKDNQPDILHTHLYHPNLYGRLASLGLGLAGVVASVHNSYTRVKLHRCLWNFLLSRMTDKVLVSSSRVWQDVHTFDRVPAAKLEVFPYGITVPDLDDATDPAQVRAELGVEGFVLGLVGRLEEQKGQRFLLAALPELYREIPNLSVLLVGEGRECEALRHLAQELGVSRLVRFLGTRRDLPRLFRAMDVFVQPSLWEGLPLTLLMAMGAGLPVVGTQVSGITEVIVDGNNGRLVAPGDNAALAGAILELYRRPELRSRMAAAGRQTIVTRYSQKAMLRRLEGIYLSIMGKKRRGHDHRQAEN
jgi:glycosyltransferase involved in cell wall biosynthesis